MSTFENAIPTRTPRLLDIRQPRAPHQVRVAPAPIVERSLPRLAWEPAGETWAERTAALEIERSAVLREGHEGVTFVIELGVRGGNEPALELTGAGAR